MIRSFADDTTRAIFRDGPVALLRHIPPDVRERARRKLDVIHAARRLDAVRALPGTRLEVLHGDLAGWLSIRVNDKWRIVFHWADGDATDVRLIDYHG